MENYFSVSSVQTGCVNFNILILARDLHEELYKTRSKYVLVSRNFDKTYFHTGIPRQVGELVNVHTRCILMMMKNAEALLIKQTQDAQNVDVPLSRRLFILLVVDGNTNNS